ncbi:MAG: type VI secretion system baseplate subunit TssK [Granulosicoccus sp.]
MHKNNRTIWTEGMFLGPHHFQQHDRFILNTIAGVSRGISNFPYGLMQYEIDASALVEGNFSLLSASGIFSDGTPFSLPDDGALPDPLEIGEDIRNKQISLAIPYESLAEKDVAESRLLDSFSRCLLHDQIINDRQSLDSDSEETVFTGGLWTRLVIEDAEQTAYHTIPLARISERRSDGSIHLDSSFFCCAMSLHASAPLQSICRDIHALLKQRAAELASQLGQPSAGDTSQLLQFMLLQIINRVQPLLNHSMSVATHPEQLFREFLQIAGEFATITNSTRLCPELPDYIHRDQSASFEPLVNSIRGSLNWIPDSTTESIPVKHIKAGIHTATVGNRDLFTSARFILAARARVTPDELARLFPQQTTISSKSKLKGLVQAQSQGIKLKHLVTVPNSIPMYDNYVYFEIQQDDPTWREVAVSGDIAMHISGNYADLQLQLWTISK